LNVGCGQATSGPAFVSETQAVKDILNCVAHGCTLGNLAMTARASGRAREGITNEWLTISRTISSSVGRTRRRVISAAALAHSSRYVPIRNLQVSDAALSLSIRSVMLHLGVKGIDGDGNVQTEVNIVASSVIDNLRYLFCRRPDAEAGDLGAEDFQCGARWRNIHGAVVGQLEMIGVIEKSLDCLECRLDLRVRGHTRHSNPLI
jgi:hypothetical protein